MSISNNISSIQKSVHMGWQVANLQACLGQKQHPSVVIPVPNECEPASTIFLTKSTAFVTLHLRHPGSQAKQLEAINWMCLSNHGRCKSQFPEVTTLMYVDAIHRYYKCYTVSRNIILSYTTWTAVTTIIHYTYWLEPLSGRSMINSHY